MICANDGCENEFERTTHNQKYCSDECCREATNQKIKQKARDKKSRLSGKQRICSARGCKTILDKYNESNVCELCNAKKRTKERNDLLEMLKNASI